MVLKFMSKKLTTEEFIEKSKEIYGNKYDYSLVEYVNSKLKVKIICQKHGTFEQIPNSHLNNKGCSRCSNNIRYTTEEFIKNSHKIHGILYDYSLVKYNSSKEKVKIICQKHGIFEQTPYNHLNKQGCPKCSNNVKYTKEELIEKFIKKYGDKYNYDLINYKNMLTKVKIICKTHGIFEQNPNNHLNKKGCPKCSNINKSIKDKFKDRSREIHNNKYDYSMVDYLNNKSIIKIICKKHGIFEQNSRIHLRGSGCPKCNRSKGELKISSYLSLNNFEYIIEYKFDNCLSNSKYKLKFDFYLPDYNLCIEYDGKQHFEPVKQFGGDEEFIKRQINDNIKNEYCQINKIPLLRISYLEDVNTKLHEYLTTHCI